MGARRRLTSFFVSLAGTAALLVLLWPLGYAVWLSFTPGELLEPPTGEWSLRWYRLFFDSPQWIDGLCNSLEIAGWSVAGALLGGMGLALAVTRYHFRGRQLVSAAVLLPLFVPAVVLAVGLLPLFHFIGLWGTRLALALAHSLICLPVVFLLLRSALEDVSPDLEAAARGLGASPALAFRRVTLPLIRPAVLAGAVMSFLLSLNEVTLALFLTTAENETLPRVIWPNLRYSLTPLVAAASCLTIGITLLGLLLVAGVRRINRFVRGLSRTGEAIRVGSQTAPS